MNWNTDNIHEHIGQHVVTPHGMGHIKDIAFTPSGELLVSVCIDGTIHVVESIWVGAVAYF